MCFLYRFDLFPEVLLRLKVIRFQLRQLQKYIVKINNNDEQQIRYFLSHDQFLYIQWNLFCRVTEIYNATNIFKHVFSGHRTTGISLHIIGRNPVLNTW